MKSLAKAVEISEEFSMIFPRNQYAMPSCAAPSTNSLTQCPPLGVLLCSLPRSACPIAKCSPPCPPHSALASYFTLPSFLLPYLHLTSHEISMFSSTYAPIAMAPSMVSLLAASRCERNVAFWCTTSKCHLPPALPFCALPPHPN